MDLQPRLTEGPGAPEPSLLNALVGRVFRWRRSAPAALRLGCLVSGLLAAPLLSFAPAQAIEPDLRRHIVPTSRAQRPEGAVLPALPSDRSSATLRDAVHPIATHARYADGTIEVRVGTGFVYDNRFFTVFHNIDLPRAVTRDIRLGGVAVEPAVIDPDHDLAIFDLPASLCERWCADGSAAATREQSMRPSHSQPIAWLGASQPNRTGDWNEGRVMEVIYKDYRDDARANACDSGIVISVDQPFVPGSSGGPVWDLRDGSVLGVIQGSFLRETGALVGYYKPLPCVTRLLNTLADVPRDRSLPQVAQRSRGW